MVNIVNKLNLNIIMMSTYCIAKNLPIRVIFMGDHIPLRTDRSQVLGRQTSKLSLWDVVFHENNSTLSTHINILFC